MVTCEFRRLVPISELGPSLPPRKPVQEKGRTRKSGPTLGLAAWAPTLGPCPGQAAGLALLCLRHLRDRRAPAPAKTSGFKVSGTHGARGAVASR